jgi:hypothetical protein
MPRHSPLTQVRQQHRKLARRLGQIGPILKGSVVAQYTRCGKVNCKCENDPPQLHGPYWQWSTAINGKTVSRRLREEEVPFYLECVENRKQVEALLADMHNLALRAAKSLKPKPATRRRPSTN